MCVLAFGVFAALASLAACCCSPLISSLVWNEEVSDSSISLPALVILHTCPIERRTCLILIPLDAIYHMSLVPRILQRKS
jgi:hypothetical protein